MGEGNEKKRASAVLNLKSKLQIIPDVSDFQSFLTELSPKRPAFLIENGMPAIPNDNTLPLRSKGCVQRRLKYLEETGAIKSTMHKEWKSTGKNVLRSLHSL